MVPRLPPPPRRMPRRTFLTRRWFKLRGYTRRTNRRFNKWLNTAPKTRSTGRTGIAMRKTSHDNRQTITLAIGIFAVLMVLLFGVVIPWLNSRQNAPVIMPTSTPAPTAVITNCDLSKYGYLGIPIPPMAPGTQQVIDIPNVGKLTLVCGANGGEATGSIQQAPTAAPIAPTAAPKRSCVTPDGFTILDGGNWKEGAQAYVCQDGAKVPVGSAPAIQPTASIPAPTAAPVQFDCPAAFVKNGAVGQALPNTEAQKDGTTDIYFCTATGWEWSRTAPVAP